jgi:cob(I)alamin adenosyltransferase
LPHGLATREEVNGDIVRYLNRLSDALFVWSRWTSLQLGVAENLWEPNAATSGQIPTDQR